MVSYEVGKPLGPGVSSRVVVGDGHEGVAGLFGVGGEAHGDDSVGGLGAEDGDGVEAGLGGGEGIWDAFADDENLLAGGVDGGSPRQAGVGAEGGGGVVVLGAVARFEVAGLEVAEVAGGVVGGEHGGNAATMRQAAGTWQEAAAGVGADVVGPQHLLAQTPVGEPFPDGGTAALPEDAFAGPGVAVDAGVKADDGRGRGVFRGHGREGLVGDHVGAGGGARRPAGDPNSRTA